MKHYKICHRQNGKTLFEGFFETARRCVEEAVGNDADLAGADLSGFNLVNGALDAARLPGACFRNTNLTGANLSDALLDSSDFTGACLYAACLRRASLRDCCFRETLFGATDIAGTRIAGSLFSGETAFCLDFISAENMADCLYAFPSPVDSPDGTRLPMSRPPVVISGLSASAFVFLDNHLLGGHPRRLLGLRLNDNGFQENLDIKIKSVV